ncbi:MAG: hypothetical protein V7746_02695 [Halioglobus sp.]
MKALPLLYCLLLLGLYAPSQASQAATTEDLLTEGRLQVRSWLTPDDNIVPGQQLKLSIEIATDRWFAGGTRISLPEVDGLVILQTDEFASNQSERRAGATWIKQLWTLEVYPQRTGLHRIGPIAAQIKINDDGTTVEGRIHSPALQFTASLPDALSRAEFWVAAPSYRLSQTFDRELAGLSVGDAIVREIVFEAEDVMAMMLPTFKAEDISGLKAYAEPAALNNRSNRGTLVSTRRQRITYIAEQEGDFLLPASDYFWWDTRSAEVQLLSLPATKIRVGAGTGATAPATPTQLITLRGIAMGAGWLLSALVLIWLLAQLPLKTIASALTTLLNAIREKWRALRLPGLPERINPGSSAGGKKASR